MLALAALLLAATPQPAKVSPAAQSLVLSGVWRGRELAGEVGVRYPTVTFGPERSSLAYEDSAGQTGVVSVRIESLIVKDADVRFAVKGAQPRYYRGRWDGKALKGIFSAEASGSPVLGTFELAPVEYDDSPRLPMTLTARRRPPERTRLGVPFGSVVFDREDQTDRELVARVKVVGARLSQVAGGPEVLEAMMDEYGRQCADSPQGTPLYGAPVATTDCDAMVAEMGRLVRVVNSAVDQAEDDARRARLQPGLVRDLRSTLGLDEGDWSRATERLKAIESDARKRR